MHPKYALPEIERRWLVEPGHVPSLLTASARTIEDKYLSSGRLRLRAVRSSDAPTIFKLGKKYERVESGSEQAVTIYLTESEYIGMLTFPGASAKKLRYAVLGGSLDIYEFPKLMPAIFEFEFESEAAAAAYEPPIFVGEEVTYKTEFSGHAIAHKKLWSAKVLV